MLMVDLSSPDGASVNDGVSENLSPLAYASIWHAVQEIDRGTRVLMT